MTASKSRSALSATAVAGAGKGRAGEATGPWGRIAVEQALGKSGGPAGGVAAFRAGEPARRRLARRRVPARRASAWRAGARYTRCCAGAGAPDDLLEEPPHF